MNPKRLAGFLSFICAASYFSGACKKPQNSILVIAHVAVIDMTGAPPASDQTVLIENGKIVAVGSASSVLIPSGAQILESRGKFLIPGLSDMHVHLTGAGEPHGSREFFLPLLVANGITSVRDMGGYLESLIPLRKEIEEGKRIGPRIVFAGPYLDGDPPAFQPAIVIKDRAQANDAIQSLKQRGVDFIKVQSNLSRDAYFAIAEAAKEQNISFVGHVPDRVTVWEAADAHQRSIEHLTGVLRACSSDEPGLMREQFRPPARHETPGGAFARSYLWRERLLVTYSEKNAQKVIRRLSEKQVWQTPTLVLLKGNADSAFLQQNRDPRMKYLPKSEQALWGEFHRMSMEHALPKEPVLRSAILDKSMKIVVDMQKAGIKVLAGTDASAANVFPGWSLHEELGLLVQAGMAPMEALQTATRNPAEFLGKLDSRGTIVVGKDADLLLLDANPLDDIRNTQKIRAVILRGKLLNRDDLNSLLAATEKFAVEN